MSKSSLVQGTKSAFYREIWDQIADLKIIDTHEHFNPMDYWVGLRTANPTGRISLPQFLERSYIYIKQTGSYSEWATELLQFRGTGYWRAWQIAMEDLYGLEAGPITPSYLKQMEDLLNNAYLPDLEKNTTHHLKGVLTKQMHVEKAIVNIGLEQHLKLPQPICQAAAGIPSILDGIMRNRSNVVYQFAKSQLGMDLNQIQTLDDYCEVTDKMLGWLKQSGHYVCIKMQHAYSRPLNHPEPADDPTQIQNMYINGPECEENAWKLGDFMMHHVLEWTSMNWRVPYQIHTGLARMYDGGSNALNLSHLFQKFPDVHFDLFHGNYPYNNLPGMLHQIRNISADLCWLPAISPTAAQRTLTEIFELGDMVSDIQYHVPSMRTSLFGGDSGIVEGSYGALQLAKDVFVRTMEDLYNRGHIFKVDVLDLANRVFYENPKRIFGF